VLIIRNIWDKRHMGPYTNDFILLGIKRDEETRSPRRKTWKTKNSRCQVKKVAGGIWRCI
jgi:hypothetical protein